MEKKSSNAGHATNMVIMHPSALREKKYKGRFRSRRPRNCLYVNEEEEEDESDQSRSEDELGFVVIKEEDLDSETREESALI